MKSMNTLNRAGKLDYAANDDVYPTEILFLNGCKVRLACSEDGQSYLRVEDVSACNRKIDSSH